MQNFRPRPAVADGPDDGGTAERAPDRADDSGPSASDDGVTADAARLKRTRWAAAAGRVGLGSRAVVYGTLAIVVAQIAVGAGRDTGADVDQGSSLRVLGRSLPGTIVLWLLALAVLCFAAWRGSEAWLGTSDPDGRETRPRVQAAIEGACYLPFGWIAVSVALGHTGQAKQGRNYQSLSAQFMGNTAGQLLVGAVGCGVVVVGGFFVFQGVRRTFRGHFDWDAMAPPARHLTQLSGTVGSVGRGLVFAFAGVLVVYAAATAEARKAGGIDSALDELASQPFGSWLLGLAALGFASFAVFALCEAAWRRTR